MAELLRDFEFDCARADCRWGKNSGGSSAKPSSLVRYAGGRDARGVVGPPGLLERGEEKVRMGRGRGVFRRREEAEPELEEEMTEAFLERSARDGSWGGSGDGVDVSTVIIQPSSSGKKRDGKGWTKRK